MNYYEPNLCYDSNYSGSDQFQPSQPPAIHQPPQETSVEISHDHENVINYVQTFLRKFNRFSFFKTPKVLFLAWDRVSKIKNAVGNKQYKPKDVRDLYRKILNDMQNIHEELDEYINIPSWNCPEFSSHDDDENYTIAITPEEPNNSLSMGDEHLNTIPATESNEVIKSRVEDLVLIPSEFEGIPDNTCDVPFRDNLEEVKDDDLREKLMNIILLIAKIKSLNENPTPDHVLKSLSPFPIPVEDIDSLLEKSDTSLSYSDNSLPEFENFSNHTEEMNSGSTTTHADYSLSKYDSFLFEIEPDQGVLTSVVILAEPRVHVPNVLTTHSTLMLDLDFIPSDNSLPESEIFYFDIEEKHSGSTTIHDDISLPDLECLNFKREPEPDELTSIVDSEIRKNVLSVTNVSLPPEDDHSPLFAYVDFLQGVALFALALKDFHELVLAGDLLSIGCESFGLEPALKNSSYKGPNRRSNSCYDGTCASAKEETLCSWGTDKEVPISKGSSVTTTEMYMENYKNVSQDIRDQLNVEAEAVQIILTGIDNDIYSTVDACPNACEMWKAIERLKQGESINVQDLETNLFWEFRKFTSRDGESLELYYSRNRGKAIVNSPPPIYDEEPSMVAEDDKMSKDKEIDKLMALISLSFKKIYKPTNNNLRTSSNTSRANQDNSPRINRSAGYDNQRLGNVVEARETVGTMVVQRSGIQCYNCKEFGHVARECQKPKRAKDVAYHMEKMLLEMVADLRYFNSLELEVDSLKSQLETQKTQFLSEINRLSREYYYVDHMNAILGVYTELDE
nr:hypothetical protein [Tanacetum cinerariifolium]